MTQAIKRVQTLSVDEFRSDFLEREQPVVISGGISHWPAITLWTDDYLSMHAGNVILRVKSRADYADGKSKRESETEAWIDMASLLSHMSSAEPPELCYARESRLLAEVRQLENDIRTPDYYTRSLPHQPNRTGYPGPIAWFGPAGTVAQLHWDPEHNLYGQVRGRKYIVVVAPEESHFTYPNIFTVKELGEKPFFRRENRELLDRLEAVARPFRSDDVAERMTEFHEALMHTLSNRDQSTLCDYLLEANNCHVDAENPNLDAHPAFRSATRFDALLSPGDLLFLPYMWHHYVRAVEPSISVNWFFLPIKGGDSISLRNTKRILAGHLAP
jgi:hypothetical protein